MNRRKGPLTSTIYDLEHIFDLYDNDAQDRIEKEFIQRVKWEDHVAKQVRRKLWQRNLDVSLPKCSKIVAVTCRLHNFIIDNDGLGTTNVEPLRDGNATTPAKNHGYLPIPIPESNLQRNGTNSSKRDSMLKEIQNIGLQRPRDNVAREHGTSELTDWDEIIVTDSNSSDTEE